jgi:hypothetical protein
VADPCTADFGSRTLVIAGTLSLPDSGDVDFSAGTIQVPGQIVSPRYPTVQLTATDDVVITGSTPLRGRAGVLQIDAGGDVDLGGRYQINAGEDESGGIGVEAGGIVSFSGSVRSSNGGMTLSGAQGVNVAGRISAPALLVGGSSINLTSSGGGITIDARINVPARHGETVGASVDVQALGDIVFNGSILAPRCDPSPCVSFSSTTGNVVLNGPIVAKRGGPIEVTAAQQAELNGLIDIKGEAFGKRIQVDASSVTVGPDARLDASVSPDYPFSVKLCLKATAGDLLLSGSFLARGVGSIVGTATAGDVIADGMFRVAPNGCVGFAAGGTVDTSGGSFDVAPSPACVANCP